MANRRPTVADILALKGRRQLTMLRVETIEEAEAAERARVDMLSVPPALLTPEFRDAAPSAFTFPGLEYGDFIKAEDYLRAAFKAESRFGAGRARSPEPSASILAFIVPPRPVMRRCRRSAPPERLLPARP